jgi:hypothetical protein
MQAIQCLAQILQHSQQAGFGGVTVRALRAPTVNAKGARFKLALIGLTLIWIIYWVPINLPEIFADESSALAGFWWLALCLRHLL